MHRTGSVLRKKGDYITILVDSRADYDTLVTKGANRLQLPPEKCCLVHMNGSKIADADIEDGFGHYSWAVGKYLATTYSKKSAYKLGIFCEECISSEV